MTRTELAPVVDDPATGRLGEAAHRDGVTAHAGAADADGAGLRGNKEKNCVLQVFFSVTPHVPSHI